MNMTKSTMLDQERLCTNTGIPLLCQTAHSFMNSAVLTRDTPPKCPLRSSCCDVINAEESSINSIYYGTMSMDYNYSEVCHSFVRPITRKTILLTRTRNVTKSSSPIRLEIAIPVSKKSISI
jgi:hypothetical protein